MVRWKNFFSRGNLEETLTNFYQHTDLKSAQWVSIAVNKKSIAESLLTKELEIQTRSDAFSLKIAESKDGFFHQLWRNQENHGKGVLQTKSPLLLEYNSLIDTVLEKTIHDFQQKLNRVDNKSFTPTEVSQEDKGLEWLRATFTLLEKAVVESLTNPELFFQAMLFLGNNPKSSHDEIRLIIFNLDIKFEVQGNGLLRVLVYNDKNAEFGSNKKADLSGDYNFRKREMLDELTKLLSTISMGIKIHSL